MCGGGGGRQRLHPAIWMKEWVGSAYHGYLGGGFESQELSNEPGTPTQMPCFANGWTVAGLGRAPLGSYGMLVAGGSPEAQIPKRHTVNKLLVDTRDLGRAPLSLALLNLEGLHAYLPLCSLGN